MHTDLLNQSLILTPKNCFSFPSFPDLILFCFTPGSCGEHFRLQGLSGPAALFRWQIPHLIVFTLVLIRGKIRIPTESLSGSGQILLHDLFCSLPTAITNRLALFVRGAPSGLGGLCGECDSPNMVVRGSWPTRQPVADKCLQCPFLCGQ